LRNYSLEDIQRKYMISKESEATPSE